MPPWFCLSSDPLNEIIRNTLRNETTSNDFAFRYRRRGPVTQRITREPTC